MMAQEARLDAVVGELSELKQQHATENDVKFKSLNE